MQNKSMIITTIISLVIGLLIGWLVWGRMPGRMPMNMHKMSDGMMMENESMGMHNMMMDMTASLKGKTGDEFDQAFLAEMIIHHEGAVDMAELVLQNSKRPEMIKLANDIITAQTGEISMMRDWQKAWFK